MPSIHSMVSTSRPVRSQSTVGTRKPGSSLVFSPSSESAAASSRRSISILVVWASVFGHLDRAQPARRRDVALLQARGEEIALEIAQESAAHAGPDHLDGDLARARRRASTSAGWTCAIEAAATGSPKLA